MVVIKPGIEDILLLENTTWIPSHTAHKDRSSYIYISSDHKYLKKTKRRRGQKRDTEFYNLAFWKEIFDSYREETGSKIYAPEPFVSDKRFLIMEYVIGFDLDRLLVSSSLTDNDYNWILENIGKLQKIKENEKLLHNDFGLRHIIINDGLHVIDLENARYGDGEVKMENQKLTALIQNYFDKDIKPVIKFGYDSVPNLHLFGNALQKVKSTFGSRAESFLKRRYRH